VDIRASQADVSNGNRQASFMLQVAGSIMGASQLPAPSYPRPQEPSTGGGGGGGGQAAVANVATVYVDTDATATTGWKRFTGMGIDAIMEVEGTGGGYGRVPRVTGTTLVTWQASSQSFISRPTSILVGFDSFRMEAQVGTTELCNGNCGQVRYVFQLSDMGSQTDLTDAIQASFRGGGDTLSLVEAPTAVQNAFQGDTDLPVLSLQLTATSTNKFTAEVHAIGVRFEGATEKDLTAVRLYGDEGRAGVLDPADLANGPLAEGVLGTDGQVTLSPANPWVLAPGSRFHALLAVDIGWRASVGAEFRATVGGIRGVYSTGVTDILYAFPAEGSSVRIYEWMPPQYRATANLRLNEIIFTGTDDNTVEIKDTSADTGIDLTSPQVFIRIYAINQSQDPPTNEFFQSKDFAGTTTSEGFAVVVMDFEINFSDETYDWLVQLRCATCGAGGGATTLDSIFTPTGTSLGAYGRYNPDGTGSWRETEENTSNDNNFIPEFKDVAVPTLGVVLLVAASGWRRRSKAAQAPEADA